ncbi:MAG: glycoside hydrolase family 2 protein [Alistipes sp.]|jgi:beta-galactosidase|nr:glycoside hydrolase family 2 protein [Alistipes sp.]
MKVFSITIFRGFRAVGVTVLATVLAVLGTVGSVSARETYNIGTAWTFFTADAPSTDLSSMVNLPHIQTTSATANYLKTIDIPAEWSGRRVFLRVGGASNVADLFVDGLHTATHRGGSAPFTVEITDRIRPGFEATLRIVVSAAPRLDVLPTAGGERSYCGIYRGVELIVCEPLSISPAADFGDVVLGDWGVSEGVSGSVSGGASGGGGDGVWITTDRLSGDRAEGSVRLALLTPDALPEGVFARARFSDAEGNVVTQSTMPVEGGGALTIPFSLASPRLWHGTRDPYLYDVEVALTTGEGPASDSISVRTGFRTVGIDEGNNFTLNGEAMRLRGVILHRDRMMVGTAITPFQTEEDIAFVLEMGANAVRVVGGRHSDYFYALCDEAGLVVWNDGPFTGAAYPSDIDFVDTEAFRENGRRQMREMISDLHNHPSVAIWGIFANVSMRSGDPVPYVRELDELTHRLDPHRLTAASSVRDGDINFVTDMISFDLSIGWETGLPDGVVPWLEQLKKGWPDLRAGISYSAGASIFQQSDRLERPSPASSYHPEGWQTFFHEEYMRYAVDAPGLWGVFVGNMFDSGAAKGPSGALTSVPTGEAGVIDDRGLVTFDRKDRKDAFWIYKANWNDSEPFVHIAGSRLETRYEHRQTVCVYSNLAEVELFVGGRSVGRRSGERGVFTWENVSLRTGVNRIEAWGGAGSGGSGSGSGALGSVGASGVAGSSGTSGSSGANSGSDSGRGAGSSSGGSGGSGSSSNGAGTASGAGLGTVLATDRASINIHPTAAATPRQ